MKLWSCSLRTTEEDSPSSRADNLHWGSESRQLHEGAARGETQRKGERKYFCDFNAKEKWRWNFLVLAFIFCFLFTFWIHFLAINLLTESLRQSTLICYMLLQCLCFIQSASFLYLLSLFAFELKQGRTRDYLSLCNVAKWKIRENSRYRRLSFLNFHSFTSNYDLLPFNVFTFITFEEAEKKTVRDGIILLAFAKSQHTERKASFRHSLDERSKSNSSRTNCCLNRIMESWSASMRKANKNSFFSSLSHHHHVSLVLALSLFYH